MFKSDLSDLQFKILCFIADFRRTHDFAPSYRDIGEACGVNSTSHVFYHLVRLVELGYLTRVENISRTVNLTAKGKQVVMPVVVRTV